MADQHEDPQATEPEAPPESGYVAPALVDLGTFQDLTQGASGVAPDAFEATS